jgi:hypothetical protein
MKQLYAFTLGFLLFGFNAFSQQSPNEWEVSTAIEFRISPPLRDLPTIGESEPKSKKEMEDRARRTPPLKLNPDALPIGVDPAIQVEGSSRSMFPPIVNWQGQSPQGVPPDPSGAAGPNHYVQAVNTTFRVYNKTGSPVTGIANLNTLWSGTANDGDPIVMYDRHADRWFISQFNISGNKVLIAVSTSPDPAGTYYTWSFTNTQFPDYLKFSIWSDAYLMTANWQTQKIIAFNRTQMLAGNPNPTVITKNFPSGLPTNGFFCPLPADADGPLPPAGEPAWIFSFEDDGWQAGNNDQIRVYKLQMNWSAPTSSVFTLAQSLPVQAFDAVFNANWNDITQPGTTQKLDAIAGAFTFRAPYYRFVNHNSVLLCNAVKLNAQFKSGIRWYELRQDNTTNLWSVYQQSTYSPDAESRWAGSMAMDQNGSIGMAYSVSSANVFPSIRYTGRLASDALNQMTFAEEVGFAGTGSQTGGINRWGDYAHTSLDPDGITFWHTGEYMVTGNNQRTRIFSFQLPTVTGIGSLSKEEGLKIYADADKVYFNGKDSRANGNVLIELFDIEGRSLRKEYVQSLGGLISGSIDRGSFATGTYLLRIGQSNFQRVEKVFLP